MASACLRDKRLNNREESLSPFTRLTATIDWYTGSFSDRLLGSGEGHASAINAQGDIAGGYRTLSGQTHCALWPSSGGMVDCHTSTVATSFSTGLDINTPGQVVGFATTSQGQRGFVWLPLIGMILLPPLPGDSLSSASGINDAGEVVGRSLLQNPACACPPFLHQAAVLWDNGQPVDLQSRVTNSTGWALTHALAINNAGVIVGTGTLDGQPHGWLLTPPPPELPPVTLPPPVVTLPPPIVTPPPLPIISPPPVAIPPPAPLIPPVVQQPIPDPSAPPLLVVEVPGDFDGDGLQDTAGLDATGGIWVCLVSRQPSCAQIYGWLTSLVAGDLDGNGRDDLAGLAGQDIWVMTDGQTWQQLPGWLDTLVIGDFYGDGHDHLAGLGGTLIWRSPRLGQWEQVYGWLDTLVAGDFDGDGRDDLAGLGNTLIWIMTDGKSWHQLPGWLRTLEVDRQAAGHADLIGWNGACWYRMHTMGQWDLQGCGAQLVGR
jgi:hypothetical protein